MDIFLQFASGAHLLASEMAEGEGGGFGLNLDLFEANVINLAIVIGILVYFGKGFLTNTLGKRSEGIEKALSEAKVKQAETAKLLAAEQAKLKNAQAEAAGIVAKASGDAARAKASILGNEEARIMRDLRLRIAELAMAQAESQLPGRLNDDSQQRLIDRSISSVGG
jgi:F-type H+-transporting ATPase subunit b